MWLPVTQGEFAVLVPLPANMVVPPRIRTPHSLGISVPSERGREKGKPVLAPSSRDNKPETFCLPDENECIIANPAFVVYSSIVSFYVPFIVTLLVYVQIYIVLRKRRKRVNTKRSSHGLDSDTQAPLKVTRPLPCSQQSPSFPLPAPLHSPKHFLLSPNDTGWTRWNTGSQMWMLCPVPFWSPSCTLWIIRSLAGASQASLDLSGCFISRSALGAASLTRLHFLWLCWVWVGVPKTTG